MATPVIMPKQGQSVENCIIVQWNKKIGDLVNKGDILVSFETDKAIFELEAETEGILLATFYNEGDVVPVLTNIAVIGKKGENIDEFKPLMEKTTNNTIQNKPVEKNKTSINETKPIFVPTDDIRISPRALKLAQKLNIDIPKIHGSGAEGRIIEKDIWEHYHSVSPSTPLAKEIAATKNLYFPTKGTGIGGRITANDLLTEATMPYNQNDAELIKISNIRRIIAQKMYESLQNSAQLTHHISANAQKIIKIKELSKQKHKEKPLSLNDLVCYVTIKAIKKHPLANSHFTGDFIKIFKKVHLGIAVNTERGLMVPAIINADDMNINTLSEAIRTLAEKCRKGSIEADLLNSETASFTISNLGAYGTEMFTPVLNLPQTCILGVNTIIERPVKLADGTIDLAPFIGLSLTYDHRVLDGAPASAFLKEIKNEIENIEIEL